MAGGYKLFSTGEVLTAANVNNYLMKQTVMVFASAAARTTALSGVLAEGMISYRTDSHVLEVYNGTVWEAPDTQLTTKGDLAVFSTVPDRLGVGSNTQVLTADSTTATGLKWATPAAGYSAPTIGSTSIGSGATVTTIAGLTLTSPTISTITNTGTVTLPTATDTLVARTTTDTLTNKTLAGSVFQYPLEAWYINATAFAGYTAYLQTNNAVHYLTTTSTANGALNITYASGTTLNTAMTTGQSISFALLITNTTAYYANSIQVDGTTSGVTTKWSGGTAPSAGNASAVDIYQFTILKTGSATFTVLAAGPIKYA